MPIPWLSVRDSFPPVEEALRNPNGLLAAGADLSTDRLLDAYKHGIFPWFGEDDPPLWWSPDPRMVLFLRELHVSRSLRRTLRSRRYIVTFDTAFRNVTEGCARPRHHDEPTISATETAETWITPVMREAYGRFAADGFAHSVEVWADDELVGGLYGVALGRMFYGESMFSRRPDASKVALFFLVRQLERWSFQLIDCQMSTEHLASLGAREIPRREFLLHVKRLVKLPPVPSPWVLDPKLAETL